MQVVATPVAAVPPVADIFGEGRDPCPDSPTGLWPEEIDALDDGDLSALAEWHLTKAGDNEGRPWWGNRIRRMSVDERLSVATNPERDALWEERERRRIADDPAYFTEGYGHVQPPVGDPEPFTLWRGQIDGAVGVDSQREVLDAIHRETRLIVLKARQLGLTWVALHYGVWVLAFNPRTPNAKVLALSKHGGDATKLLERARRILEMLPPFLRPVEEQETKRSLSKLNLVGGGQMLSLAGTPGAARSITATYAILDEFAFIQHRQAQDTWTALLPTLGDVGKAVIISTGNGPAEAAGDGQAFARLWNQARSKPASPAAVEIAAFREASQLYAIFLPTRTHPDRDDAWHARRRADFIDDEDFYAEYPDTEEQALAGKSGIKVYLPAGINAAERLGAKLDEMLYAGTLPEPSGGFAHVGIDWGEFTGILPIYPLEDGGVYIPPGALLAGGHKNMTVRDTTIAFHAATEWALNEDDEAWVLFEEARYDAAGVESMRTYRETVEELYAESRWEYAMKWNARLKRKLPSITVRGVSFGATEGTTQGTTGKRVSKKNEAKDYLRLLFKRTADGHTTRVIAISPTNVDLLRQLRGLELEDDGSGRIVKGDDHLPDALIAGVSPIAKRHRSFLLAALAARDQEAAEAPAAA